MKALGIGDLQLKQKTVDLRLQRFQRVCDVATKKEIRHIFQYGDLIGSASMEVIRKLKKFFMKNQHLQFWIIAGNRDLQFESKFELLRDRRNVTIFTYRSTKVEIEGVSVIFNPYPCLTTHPDYFNVIHGSTVDIKLGKKPLKHALKKTNNVIVAGHLHKEFRVRNTFYPGTLMDDKDPSYHYINFKSKNKWIIEKRNLNGVRSITPIGLKSYSLVSENASNKSHQEERNNSIFEINSQEDLENIPLNRHIQILVINEVFDVFPFKIPPNIKQIRITSNREETEKILLRNTAHNIARNLKIQYSGVPYNKMIEYDD